MAVVYFSGSSHSGKTTLMNKLGSFFSEDVVFHTQLVRQKPIISIDELRKNPSEYLKFQLEVVLPKIQQELDAFKSNDSKFHFFDRSIIDSLYYCTNFVDKSTLSAEDRKIYNALVSTMIQHLEFIRKQHDWLIFLLSPINSQNHNDTYRAEDLPMFQENEYKIIKALTHGFFGQNRINIIHLNVLNKNAIQIAFRTLLDLYDMDIVLDEEMIFDTYQNYSKYVQKLLLPPVNRFMNECGSIDVQNVSQELLEYENIYLPGLLTTDKKFADEIINDIKQITISQEYMNSRCYPTGILSKNALMIVGEAPGTKGRAVTENGLKPSFIYTKTSYILRKAIEELLDSLPFECKKQNSSQSNIFKLNHHIYITNLLKYAMPGNSVSHKDFNTCWNIFQKEVEYIQPPLIVALGHNTHEYLKKHLDKKYKVIYVAHPASVLYGNLKEDKYINEFVKSIQQHI